MPRKRSSGAGLPPAALASADLPPVSSSGTGVASAALSGTDRAEADKTSAAPKPARIKRAGRDFYLPRRNTAAERERDQELLSEIPFGLPAEAVAERVEQIKTRRADEMSAKDGSEPGTTFRASAATAAASAESVEPISPATAAASADSVKQMKRRRTKEMLPARARIKRAGRDWYLPCRDSDADRERDQTLLSEIPVGLSAGEVAERLGQILRRRTEEMSASDGAGERTRARIWRAGRDFYLPVRTSAAERQLDQQLLDSVPRGLARDAVEERVQQIRVRRDKEIATGVPEDPGNAEPKAKRKRLRLRPQICKETIQKSLLKGQHSRMVRESLAHEAMKCFRITGSHTEYTLLSAGNVNVCPGFRNFGNTCWLNACLQCFMHTPALRAHFLREESGMCALDVSLKRVCTCYWALAGTPRHSVIAPVDVLTALILQRPQFGGALQQDVGEDTSNRNYGSLPLQIDVYLYESLRT